MDKLIRKKGKAKLPKLWYKVLKHNKKLDKINCKCFISIDEYTAIKDKYKDIELISIGYKPKLIYNGKS